MHKLKLFRLTTVPLSFETLLKGQLRFMAQYYDVTMICSDKKRLEKAGIAEGVKTYAVGLTRRITPVKDLMALWKLYRYFRKEKPFIVHANTPKASLLSMLAAKFAKIPNRLYTVTGLRFEGESGIKRKVLIEMEKCACWAATHVIPEGEGTKNTLLKNEITNKPLQVIANGSINGIDTAYFSAAPYSYEEKEELKNEIHIPFNAFVFCFVGRLVKDKGINELVQAFLEINKTYWYARLLLVGPFEQDLDPLLPETKKEIENNKNILYVGFQADVRPYMSVSNVFVFPSYREGFPNVVMQAGAMELPCIVTDINGCNEIIEEGVNGLIIPPKNKEQLKIKMQLLLDNSSLLNQLKQNARKVITSRYEQQLAWEALLEEYKQLEKQI